MNSVIHIHFLVKFDCIIMFTRVARRYDNDNIMTIKIWITNLARGGKRRSAVFVVTTREGSRETV